MTLVPDIDPNPPRHDIADLIAKLGRAADAPIRKPPPTSWEQAGGCDNYFTSLAGSMRARGFSYEAILAAITAENDALEEPMPLARVEKIARSVARYEPKTSAADGPMFVATDAGNAERFAHHNPDLRYCLDKETWLAWDETRWAEDLGGSIAAHRALLTARRIKDEVGSCENAEIKTSALAWARKSEGADRLSAQVRVARSLPQVKCRITDFDRDPWALNLENGILDLRRGELRPHDREARCSKLAPVRFVPGARHGVLDRYLEAATGGDNEFVAFLQRALGYSLTGSTDAESIFLVLGPGGSGKTTLIEAFKDLLGDYALTTAAKTLLEKRSDGGHSSDVARMHGRRMICTSEIAKGKRLDAGLLKSLTGGERIVARELWVSDSEFRPMGKFWLAANDAPGVADDDSGMWRRIIRVPFVQVVPEAERDPAIKDTLRNDPAARSALLAWAVQGCLDWQSRGGGRQGLAIPAVVEKATSDYKTEQDALAPWLDECCELTPTGQGAVSAVRKSYVDWARGGGQGAQPMQPFDFNKRLEALGCKRAVAKDSQRRSFKVWTGITILTSGTIASF